MHEQTTSAQRSTTVSAKSLALMLVGLPGSLLLPWLAEAAGNRAGFLAAAVCVLVMAALSLALRPRVRAGRAGDQVGATAAG